MKRITCHVAVGFVAALFLTAFSAPAQITTGTVTGRVVDSSGGVIASAHVSSRQRGARHQKRRRHSPTTAATTCSRTSRPTRTPSRSPRRRSKPLRRNGIVVTGGDRVGVPPMTLEVGGTTETVTVNAEAALVQTQSGERSYAIETEADRKPADRPRKLR